MPQGVSPLQSPLQPGGGSELATTEMDTSVVGSVDMVVIVLLVEVVVFTSADESWLHVAPLHPNAQFNPVHPLAQSFPTHPAPQ